MHGSLAGAAVLHHQIPVCLWFLDRDKSRGTGFGRDTPERDRRGETLSIDARNMGQLIDRTHRELTEEELQKIAGTYHAWRSAQTVGASGRSPEDNTQPEVDVSHIYEDIPGFCKSATIEEIRTNDYVLTPGRYVGLYDLEDDDEPFEEKIERISETLIEQFGKSVELEKTIRDNLKAMGYGE